jgi:hypothetical protein
MSSEMGLICFENGDHGTLSPTIVRQAFLPFAKDIGDNYWELSFPDGGGGFMGAIEEDDQAWDISISRGSGDDFFKALFEIMRQTHTLLWWDGCDVMVTADESIMEHLPPDYIETYGVPPLVRSVEDIYAEIAKT